MLRRIPKADRLDASGQDRPTRNIGHRRSIRQEAKAGRSELENVGSPRFTSVSTLSPSDAHSSQSTALNKSRLEVLQSRAEHLDTIFDETKTKVKDLNKESDKYQSVLEGLILEVGISALPSTGCSSKISCVT